MRQSSPGAGNVLLKVESDASSLHISGVCLLIPKDDVSGSIDPSSVLIIENVERFAVLASRVPCTLLSAGTRFTLISALTFRPKAAEYKREGGTNTSKTKNNI